MVSTDPTLVPIQRVGKLDGSETIALRKIRQLYVELINIIIYELTEERFELERQDGK